MKTITFVCVAALLAACSGEKRTTRTAYDAPREERTTTTVRRIPNKPVRDPSDIASERDRSGPREHDSKAREGAADSLQVVPVNPGETAVEANQPEVTK